MWSKGMPVRDGEVLGQRLSHYHFNDLYISTDRGETPLARRLVLSGADQRATNGVRAVPGSLDDDLEEIRNAIAAVSMRDGIFHREIQVIHDGIAYRGAMIAQPDAAIGNPYEPGAPEIQTWCLRRTGDRAPSLEDLHLPPSLYRALRDSVTRRGLILVSGSFGSGKTTTSAACIQAWVEAATEIGITLEDPPEFPLSVPEGKGKIYQIDISDRDPAEAIKHMRRYAPRYVFLGEIRTPEAARELLHMSASGPLVLCTIHASDPIQALTSLILFASSVMEADMARQLAARCVSLIVHQEMANGIVQAKLLEVKDDDYGVQSKIRTGRYDLLYEDFENQKIRRKTAEAAKTGGIVRK